MMSRGDNLDGFTLNVSFLHYCFVSVVNVLHDDPFDNEDGGHKDFCLCSIPAKDNNIGRCTVERVKNFATKVRCNDRIDLGILKWIKK